MNMKKSLLLSLLTSTALITLSSCGSKASNYDPSNFLENGTNENPYQIVKEPVKIKIFAPHSSGNPEYKDLVMFQHLEKITNLRFEYITPDSSAYVNVRNGVWGPGGNIPDLFLFNNSISEQVQFSENNYNAYVPLNNDNFSYNVSGQTINVGNVINNYMPNYKKALDSNFNIDRTVSDATKVSELNDGTIYATVSAKDVARDLTYKMFINDEWISNLNEDYSLNLPAAKDIKTLDQYYTVLKAFKDYDANRNGDPGDEIPVSSLSLKYLKNYILQAFGHVNESAEINEDWSEYTYVPTTPAYREYLKFMNKIYAEGILHRNTFSITTDAALAKYGQQGKLGSFVSAAAYITVGYDIESQYKVLKPIVHEEFYNGEPLQWCFGNFNPDGAIIPSKSPYIREVARLIDIMYSELGTQLISYGVEGENWNWDNPEKTSWTFIVPEEFEGNQEQYRANITPNVNSGSALYWANDFVGKMNDEILNNLNKMSEELVPYFKVAEPQEIKMNSEEYNIVTRIKAALDPQLLYLEASYIRGDNGANPNDDASWNNFVETVKKYGVDDMMSAYNNSLNRYNKGN